MLWDLMWTKVENLLQNVKVWGNKFAIFSRPHNFKVDGDDIHACEADRISLRFSFKTII
jgi:hypothetical protein